MKNNQKGIAQVLILGLICAALMAGLSFAYVKYVKPKKNENKNTNQVVVNTNVNVNANQNQNQNTNGTVVVNGNSNTNSVVDETASWKTYTNTELGFTFKYPTNYRIHERVSGENPKLIVGSAPETMLEDLTFIVYNTGSVSEIPGGRLFESETHGLVVVYATSGTTEQKILSTFQFTDETAGWKTYTSSKYNYSFKYPSQATVSEAKQSNFSLSPEEVNQNISFAQVYNQYTGQICVMVNYDNLLGYVDISAPVNSQFKHVICGRTGVGVIIREDKKQDPLDIDGQSYTSNGSVYISEDPKTKQAGLNLDYHNETNIVTLKDGTRIEFGSGSSSSYTYNQYLTIRNILLKIVESYKKI